MNSKSTIIFGAIFLALAAYVYFFEIKGAERREEAERESKKVLSFHKENVAELKLTFPDRGIHCLKDSADLWRLVEPIETEGSKEDIEHVLTSLEDATVHRIAADSVQRLSDYGLDEPQVTVSIRQRDEGTWRSLALGDTNPTGSYSYAQRGDEPAVLLVSSTLFNSLDKDLHDLRFKKVLDFQKDEVIKMTLSHADKEIVVSKVLDQWMVEKPVRTRADGNEIDNITRKLSDAQIKEFVAEDIVDEAEYGLDRPETIVDLFVGQTGAIKSLTIGRMKDGTYYAKDASRDPVFTVDSSLVSELTKDLFDLRDKSVLAIKPHKVQEIRLQTEKLGLWCRKDTTGTWHIREPIQARADESKIHDLLWDLEGLKAEAFVSDAPPDLTPYGLFKPKARIELSMKGDSTARILSVGNKRGEAVYVKNNSAPSVYLVDSTFLEKVEQDARDYRDTKVLNFFTHQVEQIEIAQGDETSLWKKDSKGNWKGPAGRSVKKSDVTDFLNDLQSLKAEEFVDDAPSDLSAYGLAQPHYSVTLTFEEKPPQILFVGAEENEKVHVKNKETDSVFLVQPEFLRTLRTLLHNEDEGA